jgi:anti-anti-sigma factor
MRLTILRADDTLTHIALHGRLDVQGVNDIQHEFLQQTTWLPKSTLVDLADVSYIASLGISMLVSAAKTIERRGARMVLLHPTPLVRKTLETSSLHDIIPIATAEMAALELLR